MGALTKGWVMLAVTTCACLTPPPRAPTGSGPPSAPREPVAVDDTVPPYNYDDATRDTDRDGVEDPADRCPTEPGLNDANGGYRGCPKSYDADREADEPRYRYDDPVSDSDGDGAMDPEDKCPTQPGHKTDHGWGPGCPARW